jgi:hypothetical protein
LSKIVVSIQKVVFSRSFGKMQAKICLPLLKDYISSKSFYLWIFHATHDVFALVINFFKRDWKPKQITIGLFEASKTT